MLTVKCRRGHMYKAIDLSDGLRMSTTFHFNILDIGNLKTPL